MRAAILLICSLLCLPVFAAEPTAKDRVGKWEGTAVLGKMKFKMVLRIVETNDSRIAATMDLPEHGQRGMPIGAVLFNSPDVRIEIDPFQTAYNAELSEDLSTMNGGFEDGTGGRPIGIVFKRSTTQDEPEPEQVFTLKPGEERDIRGYWKAAVEPMPGMKLTAGLNVGRIPDGSFKATLDILEQGAKDIPAGAVAQTGRDVEMKWEALQMNFKGKLSEDGNKIEGEMKQRGKPEAVTFARIDSRATLAPADVSYEANPADPNDVRGEWSGKL